MRRVLPLLLLVLVALGAWLLWNPTADRTPDADPRDARESSAERPPVLKGTRAPEPAPDAPTAAEPTSDPALTVRVLRRGEPVPDAEVVVGDALAGRERATLSTARTDAQGLARFQEVGGVKVGVFAAAPGMGRGYLEVALPRQDIVDVHMPDDRTVTIHVRRGDTQRPVAGAEVMLAGPGTMPFPRGTGCLPPLPEVRTDPSGNAVVSGLPQEQLWVVARAPRLAMKSNGLMVERVMLEPSKNETTVTLWPHRVVRFPIKTTGAGAPDDGTKLELRRYQPMEGYDQSEPGARIEDGHLVLEPFPPGFDWGHVISPQGTWALWKVPQGRDLGEAVEFRTIYDIRVRLLWKGGAPAADQILFVILEPRGEKARVRTDGEGSAVFPTCVAESAHVMWAPRERGSGVPIVRVNLVADPGETTVAINRPIDYEVCIRVNGEPCIPEDCQVYVRGMAPDRPPEELRWIVGGLEEDAERGEVRFRWLPLPSGEASPVTIRAPGLPTAAATPVRGADGVWRATVELQATTTLRVRLGVPQGLRYYLNLERWRDELGRYVVPEDQAARQTRWNAVKDVHTFRGFPPGRYRLREHNSGITSEPFELVAGGEDLDMTFSLSAAVVVRGRVVVPEGENPAYATVRLADRVGGGVSRSNPVRVNQDGTYEFRAPAGERHRLVVKHPLLVPKDAPPEFVVGGAVPVIHLVAGPQLTFRIQGSDRTTPEPGAGMSAPQQPQVRVRMARPGEWKPEGYGRMTIAKNGVFRVGVPEPGTWDVRIEQHRLVPHVVRGVEVGQGPVDLGTVSLSEGATLTVRLFKGEQPFPKHPLVRATLVSEMPYSTSSYNVEAGDPPFIKLSGLGRGRFRVVVSQLYVEDGDLSEHEVVSDGENDTTLDVRLP